MLQCGFNMFYFILNSNVVLFRIFNILDWGRDKAVSGNRCKRKGRNSGGGSEGKCVDEGESKVKREW